MQSHLSTRQSLEERGEDLGSVGLAPKTKWWVKHQSFVPAQQQTEHQTFFFISKKEMSVRLVDCREKYHTTPTLKVTITQQQVSEAVMNDLLKKPTSKGDILKKKTLAKSSNVPLTDRSPWEDGRNFSSGIGNSSSHLQNRNPTHPSSKSLQQNL
jgi:GTPase SAR1 family protein